MRRSELAVGSWEIVRLDDDPSFPEHGVLGVTVHGGDCDCTVGCDCGCCQAGGPSTPLAIANRAGLAAIAYRVGTYASFRATRF